MMQDSASLCSSILAVRSAWSIVPSEAVATTTTFMPASTAEAAFVPCAEAGIRQTVRWASPRERW